MCVYVSTRACTCKCKFVSGCFVCVRACACVCCHFVRVCASADASADDWWRWSRVSFSSVGSKGTGERERKGHCPLFTYNSRCGDVCCHLVIKLRTTDFAMITLGQRKIYVYFI